MTHGKKKKKNPKKNYSKFEHIHGHNNNKNMTSSKTQINFIIHQWQEAILTNIIKFLQDQFYTIISLYNLLKMVPSYMTS
jgi:hypothetical protein